MTTTDLPAGTSRDQAALLRPHAEQQFAAELAALAAQDAAQGSARPPSWVLSPGAVVTYLLGGATAYWTLRRKAEFGKIAIAIWIGLYLTFLGVVLFS